MSTLRLTALLAVTVAAGGCDLFFYDAPSSQGSCAAGWTLLVEGSCPCEPMLTLDGCRLSIEGRSCQGDGLPFEATAEGETVSIAPRAGCTITGSDRSNELRCEACTYVIERAGGTPPYHLDRRILVTDERRTDVPSFYQEQDVRLTNRALRSGYLDDFVVPEAAAPTPIVLGNSRFLDTLSCDQGGTRTLGPVGRPAPLVPDCLQRLVPWKDGATLGIFDDALSLTAVGPESVTATGAFRLSIGEDESLLVRDARFDPVSGDTAIIAEIHGSASLRYELVVLDGAFQRKPTRPIEESAELAHLARDNGGWLVSDTGLRQVLFYPDDLERGATAVALGSGHPNLGSVAVLVESEEAVVVDVFEGVVLVVDREKLVRREAAPIAQGRARLTPTSLELTGIPGLLAVGLLDQEEKDGYVGFFDRASHRFLPDVVMIGHGAPTRFRNVGRCLYVMLPWEGSIVALAPEGGACR